MKTLAAKVAGVFYDPWLMQRTLYDIMDFTVSEKTGQGMSGRRNNRIVYWGYSGRENRVARLGGRKD